MVDLRKRATLFCALVEHLFFFGLFCRCCVVIRPKIHGYTGYKRTCALEQAVSCV